MASKIKVDTIETVAGSGNITASNTIAGTSATLSGTLGVTGATTLSSNVGVNGGTGGQVAVNYSTASTTGLKLNDTNSGNLGGFIDFRSGSGAGTQRATIQNANNAGIHVNVGTGGSLSFATGYTSANALDDYEEGTWTVTDDSGAGLSITQTRVAQYIKIGTAVHVNAYVTMPSTSNASPMLLGGLPFIPAKSCYGSGRIQAVGSSNLVFQFNEGSANIYAMHPHATVSNATASTSYILFSGVYQTS